MNGEIGVHNDAPFVKGKIGEDCGMGGAVTIKELKGLPDCGCGDCNGIVDFGSSMGRPVVAFGVENRNLSEKDGSVNGDTVRVVVKGCVDGVNAYRKEIIVNGRVEGDDQTGNGIGKDAEVKRWANGVRENGDYGANGHVPEIKVDAAEGKRGDLVVERNYEVETKHDAEENGENGVIENGDCGADGSVERSEIEVLENNDCDDKTENAKEVDIADHNDDIECNNVDCSLSKGVAREESLSKTQDIIVEDTVVEEQIGKVEVMDYVDGLTSVDGQSELVEGLSGGVESHPAADPVGTSEELPIDQAKPGMQEGLSQTGGSIVGESSDFQMLDIKKSHDENQNADQTHAAFVVAVETYRDNMSDQQIQSTIEPISEQVHISESNLCSSAEMVPHNVGEANIEVLSLDDKVEKGNEETNADSVVAAVVSSEDMHDQEIEFAIEPVPEQDYIGGSCNSADMEPHKVGEANVEVLSVDDKVEKVDKETEEERGSHQDVILQQEVEARDVSVKDVITAQQNLSTEEANG